jgi:tRNA(Ile)-lysidine synthase TilS/MesJ
MRKKYFNINFDLSAAHINISNIPYDVDINFLEDFCKKRDVDFIYIEKKIHIDHSKITTNPCFICSWNRRKLLFNYTKEHNFNKLALGHHRDDAIETFLINLIYHATISSLPAKLSMFSGRLNLIRPLIYLTKNQISDFAEIKGYEAKLKTCSFDNASNRKKISYLLDEMRKFNPQVDNNIFKALSNVIDEYLPK